MIVVTLYRRVFVRFSFRGVKPPLVRCTAENNHNNHYERGGLLNSRGSLRSSLAWLAPVLTSPGFVQQAGAFSIVLSVAVVHFPNESAGPSAPRERCQLLLATPLSPRIRTPSVDDLETELDRARDLPVSDLADAIEAIGFECTQCGACCRGATCGDGANNNADDTADADNPEENVEEHTATIFPNEVRQLQARGDYDWRDVARPMPYGVSEGPDGPRGETFEWALQTDGCGDCRFYEGDADGGVCTVYEDRPLICRTYPFSIGYVDKRQHSEGGGLGTTEPMGGVVEQEGMVRAHECEGLGRDISREDAEELAAALKERASRELEEAIGVRDNYGPTDVDGVVVHDSEGQKQPDGTLVRDEG